MFVINFNKERGQHFVDCLANGKPIKNPEGGWSGNDMAALAGVCFAAVLSQGPGQGAQDIDMSELPKEHREFTEEQFFRDIHAGIEFYSQLAMAIRDEEYDSRFEANVKAIVVDTGDEKKLFPFEGFKTQ